MNRIIPSLLANRRPSTTRDIGLWPSDLTHFFEQWPFANGFSDKEYRVSTQFNPSVEVSEDKQAFEFKFDLPGIPREQIKVNVQDNQLTVSGERREEKKDDAANKHYSELSYGSFSRSFSFPTAIDSERTEAKYDHGVLLIRVPKANQARTREVSIK